MREITKYELLICKVVGVLTSLFLGFILGIFINNIYMLLGLLGAFIFHIVIIYIYLLYRYFTIDKIKAPDLKIILESLK